MDAIISTLNNYAESKATAKLALIDIEGFK